MQAIGQSGASQQLGNLASEMAPLATAIGGVNDLLDGLVGKSFNARQAIGFRRSLQSGAMRGDLHVAIGVRVDGSLQGGYGGAQFRYDLGSSITAPRTELGAGWLDLVEGDHEIRHRDLRRLPGCAGKAHAEL